MSTIESLQKTIDNGDKAWGLLREETNNPHDDKAARKFSTQDAARLIGRAESSIRAAEKRGAIPPPVRDNRNHRMYSIHELDQMREVLGATTGREEGDDLCTVSIITYKGGAGKTTTAISLAQRLTLSGKRVLLIDCDPQASCTSYFNTIPNRDISIDDTIYRVLVAEERGGRPSAINPEDMAAIIRPTHWGRLKLIPANLELHSAEYMMLAQAGNRRSRSPAALVTGRLQAAINTVADDYDVVVLDAPPSLGMISMNVVKASDGLISPIQPSIIDFASTQQFLSMVVELLEMFGGKELSFFRVLINNYLSHPNTDHVVGLIRAVYGAHCMDATMGRTQEINNASMQLKTVYELERPTSDSKTYRRAMSMLDDVNAEIESLIETTWPSRNPG